MTADQIKSAEVMLSRMARAARCFPQSAADQAALNALEFIMAEVRHVGMCWAETRDAEDKETITPGDATDSRNELTRRLFAAVIPSRM